MSEFLEFVKETLDKKVPAKIPIKRLYITDCIDYENIEDFLIFLHLFMHVNDINLFQFRDKIISTLENKSNDSDFKLNIAFSKNKFDKRIKEISLKGDIKIYNGWFFYIFKF